MVMDIQKKVTKAADHQLEGVDNDAYDTIAAIATAVGVGGIGIIRLSGPKALVITNEIVALNLSLDKESSSKKENTKNTKEKNSVKQFISKPRYVYYGHIQDPDRGYEVVDEGCVTYFQGPYSYTGDDVVELQLHGSPYILKRVLIFIKIIKK